MEKITVSAQTTLLVVHKGVDLHAATAERVMRERLPGGRFLVQLQRAEYHTCWGQVQAALQLDRLLEAGPYFNPNKHFYGYFRLADGGRPWSGDRRTGDRLPDGWPGCPLSTDRGDPEPGLGDRLLGGPPAPGCVAVDVCTYPLGQTGPLLGGVLWRLVLRDQGEETARVAADLVVARGGRHGLLVNPHMQGWLLVVRAPSPDYSEKNPS